MITKLTKKQKALLPVYRDKWLKIGLSTEPSNHVKAEDAINRAYEMVGLEKPKQFVWCGSPQSAAITLSILKNEKVMKEIWGKYAKDFKLGDSVRDSVEDSVRASVWDSVLASVRASVLASVGASVGNSVWALVWDSVWDSVEDSVRDSMDAFIFGQQDAGWIGFYNYFLEVCGIEKCRKLKPFMDLAEEVNWWAPFKKICLVCEKPTICKLKGTQIHCEDGPAIAYQDGFEIYALNGVHLSKEIVMTPANQLSCGLVLKETNADVRRELIRKIGITRIISELGAQELDSWKDYKLLLLDLKDGRHRPYLQMKNPSIEAVHIEGVPPDIKTVKQALAWRNGLEEYIEPAQLT